MSSSMRLLLVIILPAILVVVAAVWFTRNQIFAARDAVTGREEAAAIKELIEAGRTAHIDEDAAAIVASQADDMIFVSHGVVERRTRQQTEARFTEYFGEVDFVSAEWLAQPQVKVLPGGKAAYSFATMRIIYAPEGEADNKAAARYHDFAWSTVWEKREGEWLRVEMTSTDGDEGAWPIKDTGGEKEGAAKN